MKRRSLRRGITLLELIVVVFVIVIILALLLPASSGRAPGAEKRWNCMHHLKILGLALTNYESVHKCFPAAHYGVQLGSHDRYIGGLAGLLPYMENEQAFKQINFSLGIGHAANVTVKATRIREFVCPADTPVDRSILPTTNYFLCAGVGPSTLLEHNRAGDIRGCFSQASSTKFDDITDGHGKTIAFVESGVGSPDVHSQLRQYAYIPELLPRRVPIDAGAAAFEGLFGRRTDRGSSWMDGRYMQSLSFVRLPPNSELPDCTYYGMEGGVSGPRSFHRGGAQVAFADGSASFLSDQIDVAVMNAMGTINGGEKVKEGD